MLSSLATRTARLNGSKEARHPEEINVEQRALPFSQFVWGSGLECSFIPHLNVNQFAWTQHDRFWKDDFKLAREVAGITHLRYALPWHEIETQPGKFDWRM